jgi:hypothetical protein
MKPRHQLRITAITVERTLAEPLLWADTDEEIKQITNQWETLPFITFIFPLRGLRTTWLMVTQLGVAELELNLSRMPLLDSALLGGSGETTRSIIGKPVLNKRTNRI